MEPEDEKADPLAEMSPEEFAAVPGLHPDEVRVAFEKGQNDLMKVVSAQRPVRQDSRLRFR